MFPAPFIAVVDANVLVNACVRDLVLRAAAADFFQLRWSEQILVVALIHQQARDLDKPPSTTDQLLDRLARYTPDVVALARHRLTIKKR
ncbi:MAG: hypothetical protein IPK80_18635 [Nannocystis sp.]|nr:hypothetical protein [Nannocystis sp.]